MRINFVQVPKLKAQKVKTELIESNAYNYDFKPLNDDKWVYFAVSDTKKAKKYGQLVKKKGIAYKKRTPSLKEILIELGLTGKQIATISSYDTVGEVAILKITEDMKPFEKKIAKALLESNSQLKTIVKKTKEHSGVYRVQGVKWLAGKKELITYVKESGAVFKVKVGEMFFSPRLSFERQRIANLIKPKTNICVFFAGVAPFSIVIAKQNPEVNKVYSIELNPKAHKAALENIKLNKLEGKVEAICADVNKFSEKTKNWADNIIMPLPKTSDSFLEAAYKVSKKYKDGSTGLISIYKFVPVSDPYGVFIKELRRFGRKKGLNTKIEFKRQVRDYSSKIIQIVVDFRFMKMK